jgi:hypothetical protein
MQSVLGRAHFSQEQSERWHRAHKPRPDQQAMSARIAELGRQVFADWRFAYAIVPLGILALAITLRQRSSQLLLLLLIGLTAFWLLETHLQGRFYVLAMPIAAIAIAMLPRPTLKAVAIGAAFILLYGTGASLVRVEEMKSEFSSRGIDLMTAAGFANIDQTGAILDFFRVDPKIGRPVVLVGDAQAFGYQIPMDRLYYRTVFDVDVKPQQNLVDAYTADVPPGTPVYLWINFGELERFGRTYQLPLKIEDHSVGTTGREYTIPAK